MVSLPLTAFAEKSRLEERLSRLFFWQMSQALDLSPSEEKEMTQILSLLHQRRLTAIDQRDELHERIHAWVQANKKKEFKKVPPEVTSLLKEYREKLDAISKIDVDEQEQMQKLLGEVKLLKFYDERKSIIEQVKSALN